MIAERFWELLSKQAFAEANESELREFSEILSGNPHLQKIAESITIMSNQALPTGQDEEAEFAFRRHVARMKEIGVEFSEDRPINAGIETEEQPAPGFGRRMRKWSFVFASILVLTIIFLSFRIRIFSSPQGQKIRTTLSQVTTKPASKTQIQLPDGSTVWLNASSNLTYDKDFGKEFREVNLTGEAFFDVAKDASRPFIIHTKVLDVKVLGTEFNVRAYPNDAYTETSLIRGSVEITLKNRPDEKLYLKPNEKMSVSNNILEQELQKTVKSTPPIRLLPLSYVPVDSTIIETSWMNDKLIFQQNETFRELALKMERRYGVTINFASDQVADDYRPFGSFKSENINQALDELKEGYKFSYKIDGGNIFISQ